MASGEWPSREEVREKLLQVCQDRISRNDASDWAARAMARIEEVDNDAAWFDEVVWEGLYSLVMADAQTAPGEWLYGDADLLAWLDEYDRMAAAADLSD